MAKAYLCVFSILGLLYLLSHDWGWFFFYFVFSIILDLTVLNIFCTENVSHDIVLFFFIFFCIFY